MEKLQGKEKRKIKQVYDLRDIEIGTVVRFRREGQPLSYFEGRIYRINGEEKDIFYREPSFLVEYKNENNKLVVDHVLYSNILEIVKGEHKMSDAEIEMVEKIIIGSKVLFENIFDGETYQGQVLAFRKIDRDDPKSPKDDFLIRFLDNDNVRSEHWVHRSRIHNLVEVTHKTNNEGEHMEKNQKAHPRSVTEFGDIIGIVRNEKLSFGKIVEESNELKVGDKGVVTLKDSHSLINNQEVDCEVVEVRTFCYVEIASLNKRAWVPADNITWYSESNEKRQRDD